jgi:bacterioferritin-associated ferredoxin
VYVCHCRAVSDREIREAVEAGHRTVEELGRSCGAGTDCGGCHDLLADLAAPRPSEMVSAGADVHD